MWPLRIQFIDNSLILDLYRIGRFSSFSVFRNHSLQFFHRLLYLKHFSWSSVLICNQNVTVTFLVRFFFWQRFFRKVADIFHGELPTAPFFLSILAYLAFEAFKSWQKSFIFSFNLLFSVFVVLGVYLNWADSGPLLFSRKSGRLNFDTIFIFSH